MSTKLKALASATGGTYVGAATVWCTDADRKLFTTYKSNVNHQLSKLDLGTHVVSSITFSGTGFIIASMFSLEVSKGSEDKYDFFLKLDYNHAKQSTDVTLKGRVDEGAGDDNDDYETVFKYTEHGGFQSLGHVITNSNAATASFLSYFKEIFESVRRNTKGFRGAMQAVASVAVASKPMPGPVTAEHLALLKAAGVQKVFEVDGWSNWMIYNAGFRSSPSGNLDVRFGHTYAGSDFIYTSIEKKLLSAKTVKQVVEALVKFSKLFNTDLGMHDIGFGTASKTPAFINK